MITEEEYNKWAPLVSEYEEALASDALANSLYCTECQAVDFHDCFCESFEENDICSYCSQDNYKHSALCPYASADDNN